MLDRKRREMGIHHRRAACLTLAREVSQDRPMPLGGSRHRDIRELQPLAHERDRVLRPERVVEGGRV